MAGRRIIGMSRAWLCLGLVVLGFVSGVRASERSPAEGLTSFEPKAVVASYLEAVDRTRF